MVRLEREELLHRGENTGLPLESFAHSSGARVIRHVSARDLPYRAHWSRFLFLDAPRAFVIGSDIGQTGDPPVPSIQSRDRNFFSSAQHASSAMVQKGGH